MQNDQTYPDAVMFRGRKWSVVGVEPATVSSPVATNGTMSHGMRLELRDDETASTVVAYGCVADPGECLAVFDRVESLRPHMKVHAVRPVGKAVASGVLLSVLGSLAEELERVAGKAVDIMEDISDELADMGIAVRRLEDIERMAESAQNRRDIDALRKEASDIMSKMKGRTK